MLVEAPSGELKEAFEDPGGYARTDDYFAGHQLPRLNSGSLHRPYRESWNDRHSHERGRRACRQVVGVNCCRRLRPLVRR